MNLRSPATTCTRCGAPLTAPGAACGACGSRVEVAETGEFAPGTRVAGRYVIGDEIGAGGMGRVYRAVQQPLGNLVCVKTLHSGAGQDPQFAARFEREARATSRMRHPNIVSVIDFGTHVDGSLYLVMELVEGKTLASFAGRGKTISAVRAVRILSQLCDALTFAHGLGVIHRDLKPANVMVIDLPNEPDFVKVLDFGSALMLDSGEEGARLTQVGMLIGTPAYMAPEYILGRGADGRVDVYAVGVMLYTLLCGSSPFRGTAQAIYAQQVSVQPDRPRHRNPDADVSAAMEAVILRALAKDPAKRFPTADALSKAMRSALEVGDDDVVEVDFGLDESLGGNVAVEVAHEDRATIAVSCTAAGAIGDGALAAIAPIARARGGVFQARSSGARVVFGLDRDVPEAAADAMRCALELAALDGGQTFGVGVRDGQASCRGRAGAPGFQYSLFGEGVAIADSLAAHARPGTVLISGPASRHVPVDLRLRPVAPPAESSDPAFMLGDPEGAVPGRLPFVGRADSVRALLEIAADARQGRIHVIEGPVGIGKSRLVHEAVTSAARVGVLLCVVEASALARLGPSHVVCQLAALGWSVPGSGASTAERYAVEMMLGLPPKSDDLAGERRQLRLVGSALEGVARRAAHGGLVIVFDRMENADELTWAVARRLVDVSGALGVSVVLCVRKATSMPFGLPENATRVQLGPLSAQELQVLARSAPDVAASDVALVAALSRGSPLIAEEALRSLTRGEREAVERARDLEPREALELLVSMRVAGLPPESRRIAAAAAILGIESAESEAIELSSQDAFAIDPLADAGILGRTATGRLCFAHPIARTAVLASLEQPIRAMAHEEAARLVARAPDGEQRLAEQADHMLEAGLREEAFALLVRAAEESYAEGATGRAADQLRSGLAAAATLGDVLRGERASAARKLGRLLMDLGQLEEALQVLVGGFPLARAAGADDLAADLLRLHGRALALDGDVDGGRSEIDSSFAFAQRRGFVEVAAEACADLADAAEARDRLDEAAEALKRGLDLLGSSEDPAAITVRIQLYNRLGRLDLRSGNVAGAIALFTQALDLAERTKDRHQGAGLLGNLGGTYAKLGQMDRALHFTERALRESEGLGDPIGVARQSFNLALLRLALGHADAARKLLRTSYDASTRAGWREGLAMSTAALAKIGPG